MGIETFPEIENFQHLPRKVIVKGGSSSFDDKTGAELQGIVINNSGHAIKNLRVCLVVFDEHKIPVLNVSAPTEPSAIHQGGIGSFSFRLSDYQKPITDYYLYTAWAFDG